MYFDVHPIKVCLLEIGNHQRKCKYIRIVGVDMENLFKYLIEELRLLVDSETSTNNTINFYCVWMDYANDEIEIRNVDDFWCWAQFVASNTMYHPEIIVKPVVRMGPPSSHARWQAYPQQPVMQFNGPPFPRYRPSGPVYYNVRAQQLCRVDAGIPEVNGPQAVSGQETVRNSNENSPYRHMNGSAAVQLSNERPPNTIHLECLRRLRNMGFDDKSGGLARIIDEANGDFDKAYAVLQEALQDTESNSD